MASPYVCGTQRQVEPQSEALSVSNLMLDVSNSYDAIKANSC